MDWIQLPPFVYNSAFSFQEQSTFIYFSLFKLGCWTRKTCISIYSEFHLFFFLQNLQIGLLEKKDLHFNLSRIWDSGFLTEILGFKFGILLEGFKLYLMVQLMGSLHSENFEDFSEEEYGSLPKRTRLEAASSNQVWVLFILLFLGVYIGGF